MKPDLNVGRRFLDAQGAPGAFLVGVTGAHYYGFPSADSDLDLKGIHIAPTRDVVSLNAPPDAFDFLGVFEGVEIDYISQELAVALRLLLKGNGNMLERILSPFQLFDSPAVRELQALAAGAVSQRFFHHYRGFFGRMRDDWRAAQTRTTKGLLYAYRSALTGIHLLRTGECVGNVTRLAPLYGFDRIADLVTRKIGGREHDALGDACEFEGDLDRLDPLLEAAREASRLPTEAPNFEALNEFLIRTRKAWFE